MSDENRASVSGVPATGVSRAPGTGREAAGSGLLEVVGLEVAYQDVIQALNGVTITVPEGEVVAVLGPNGAGKTTLLRAITGLLDFHDGEIVKGECRFDGADVTGVSAARMVSRGVAQVLEGRQIFPTLTVEENLRVGALGRPDPAVREDLLERFPVLRDRATMRGGFLSGGEQQMLAMARALISQPRLLVLDEPSLGLAPQLVDRVADLIAEINASGTAILLVEQNAGVALDIASYGYVLENGRIVMDGVAEKLSKDADILEFYLGIAEGGERKSFADVKHYRRRKRWLS